MLTAASIAITSDTLREMDRLYTPIAQAIIDSAPALLALPIGNQFIAGNRLLKGVAFFAVGALLDQKYICKSINLIDQS